MVFIDFTSLELFTLGTVVEIVSCLFVLLTIVLPSTGLVRIVDKAGFSLDLVAATIVAVTVFGKVGVFSTVFVFFVIVNFLVIVVFVVVLSDVVVLFGRLGVIKVVGIVLCSIGFLVVFTTWVAWVVAVLVSVTGNVVILFGRWVTFTTSDFVTVVEEETVEVYVTFLVISTLLLLLDDFVWDLVVNVFVGENVVVFFNVALGVSVLDTIFVLEGGVEITTFFVDDVIDDDRICLDGDSIVIVFDVEVLPSELDESSMAISFSLLSSIEFPSLLARI